jgi:hypothetical protein
MTNAVCTRCGAFKAEALGPCPACRFDPAGQGIDAEARAMWLTIHHRSRAELEAAAAAIAKGEDPGYDEVYLQEVAAHAQKHGKSTLVESARGVSPLVIALMVLPLAICALLLALLMR